MKLLSKIRPLNMRCRHLAALRHLVVMLASLALISGQVVPAAASHMANQTAGFVEICGEDGSRFVQLDSTGNEREPCRHCGLCAITIGGIQGLIPVQSARVNVVEFTSFSFLLLGDEITGQPDNIRPANRGPPDRTTNNQMTTPTLLPIAAPAESDLIDGNIPCV